jgi:hypothetical protein
VKLAKQQTAQFETFGYPVRRQLFPPDEMAVAGKVKTGNFIGPCPRLICLAAAGRICGPVSQLPGPGFIRRVREMIGNVNESWGRGS